MDSEIEGGPASSHMSAHTSGRMSTRIEVVAGRRRWTVEQKLAILRDAFGPDGSVGDACKRSDGRACGAFDQDVIALRSAASPTVR